MPKLEKIINIKADMVVLTGIKIGGAKDKFDIGGLDNPVIRTVVPVKFLKENIGVSGIKENEKEEYLAIPYIPGSSLKGRMRALLELKYGKTNNGEISTEKPFRKVFGISASEAKENETTITRAIFRDAYPTKETIEMWLKLSEEESTFDLGTELKIENKIDRLTSKSKGLRSMERVIPGSKFKVEINLLIFEEDVKEEQEWIKLIKEGFKLIEETYLGGCGTRGYGKVRFENIEINSISLEQIKSGE